MPHKFHESRRHKFPKARYRVTNWPEYDAALVRRGSLTLWFTEEAVAAWRAPATGERGGQPIYSATSVTSRLSIDVDSAAGETRKSFHAPVVSTFRDYRRRSIDPASRSYPRLTRSYHYRIARQPEQSRHPDVI
jgi:hypothetical protein